MAWPRDAHAMEAAHVDNLQRLIGFSDQHPQLKTQLQGHLEISKHQCDEIEHKLKRLGTDTSTLKDWAMKLAGWIEPLASRLNFLFEHLPVITQQYLPAARRDCPQERLLHPACHRNRVRW
jgi:predicted nuclease with TOPRIM domain